MFDQVSYSIDTRRRKPTMEEEDEGATKPTTQEPLVVSEEPTPTEKTIRKPIALTENGEDEQAAKKKRRRTTKIESTDEVSTAATPPPSEKKIRRKPSSSTKEPSSSKRRSKITNGNENEHEQPAPSSNPTIPPSIIHLLQASTNPPLSNYEQKQIVDGLLCHPNEKNLTFDEAQTYAMNKATEISKRTHVRMIEERFGFFLKFSSRKS